MSDIHKNGRIDSERSTISNKEKIKLCQTTSYSLYIQSWEIRPRLTIVYQLTEIMWNYVMNIIQAYYVLQNRHSKVSIFSHVWLNWFGDRSIMYCAFGQTL